jgi:hypothetical protein
MILFGPNNGRRRGLFAPLFYFAKARNRTLKTKLEALNNKPAIMNFVGPGPQLALEDKLVLIIDLGKIDF